MSLAALEAGSVEMGWHAPRAAQSAALRQALPWMAPAGPGLYAAVGGRGLSGWALRALAPALAEGVAVHWIDAGNRFDERGLDFPSRVRLTRPRDAHELESFVCAQLPEIWRGELLVLADPFFPLSDAELPESDAQRVFSRLLQAARAVPAPWLVLAMPRPCPPPRERMMSRLLHSARRVATPGAGLG
ncbi:MAG TPA: hypothetical protein VNI01_13230 [Elusimicrobiota bacterium]|jgi:hypothetical protein|nr:hypothetical protein [Elusimicrobiota bacterium]